jgi:hypothetical protein
MWPYIPPQPLWRGLYGVFVFLMNLIFKWILLFLILVYITWLIIKKYVPNFPIPFKMILLRMPPWRPLEKAGVLQLIDSLRKIIFSNQSVEGRLSGVGRAVGNFFGKSLIYVQSYTRAKISGVRTPAPPTYSVSGPSSSEAAIRKGSKPSPYEEDEVQQIQDEYLQCIEEETIPIYNDMGGMEKAQALIKNSSASTKCKVKSMQSYSKLISNRPM